MHSGVYRPRAGHDGGAEVTEKRLYKVADAADAASVSKSTAYELVRSGEWPHVRVGSHIKVVAAGLDEWVQRLLKDAEDRAGYGLRWEDDEDGEPRLVRP
jgi:excisionase family DNA binding protein